MRLFSRVRRWLATIDAKGAAAVEFALVGSAFMLMLLAAFEFGYMLFVQSVLDNAARDAARLVRTGQLQSSGNPSNTFSTLLCSEVGSLIGCGNLVYQSQAFNNWTDAKNAINNPVPNPPFNPGTASQIMVVTVSYDYPFLTAWIGNLLGGSGQTAQMQSTVVFQNEPY